MSTTEDRMVTHSEFAQARTEDRQELDRRFGAVFDQMNSLGNKIDTLGDRYAQGRSVNWPLVVSIIVAGITALGGLLVVARLMIAPQAMAINYLNERLSREKIVTQEMMDLRVGQVEGSVHANTTELARRGDDWFDMEDYKLLVKPTFKDLEARVMDIERTRWGIDQGLQTREMVTDLAIELERVRGGD